MPPRIVPTFSVISCGVVAEAWVLDSERSEVDRFLYDIIFGAWLRLRNESGLPLTRSF